MEKGSPVRTLDRLHSPSDLPENYIVTNTYLRAAGVLLWCGLALLFSASLSYGQDSDPDAPLVGGSGVGYIDIAPVVTQFRFRYEATYNNEQPARAEFFWAIDGPFGPGPGPETRIDYQDFSPYLEVLLVDGLSVFGELPVRLLEGEIQDNTGGLADLNVGFKYALIQNEDRFATFQLRTYAPSGDTARGLSTDHVSLEPGVLFLCRLSDLLTIEGELKDWIAVGGTDEFAGNVLRYGLGGSVLLVNGQEAGYGQFLGVTEFVGWTVLEGDSVVTTSPTNSIVRDAEGDTIVNVKLGIRWVLDRFSLYTGYGRALTGQSWYDDVLRVEGRLVF